MRRRWRAAAVVAALAVTGSAAYAYAALTEPEGPLLLKAVAISGSPDAMRVHAKVPDGTSWVPGSSVLRLPDGTLSAPTAAVEESRRWLAAGVVPGTTPAQREMAERALHDLRLLTLPSGASLAGPEGIWAYVWPRDAAFVAAALAATGHGEDGVRVLRWVASEQRSDGTWAARTRPDGSGPPDDRADQLDACGWFPWALRFVLAELRAAGEDAAAEEALQELGPAALLAARGADVRVGPDGVPQESQDYWENSVDGPTLGTASVLAAGMRAAADLARQLGEESQAGDTADRLEEALAREWPGADRYPGGHGGADSAVAWLAPPFGRQLQGAAAQAMRTRLLAAEEELRGTNGGLRPGEGFGSPEVTWTPETAMFALAYASLGDRARAEALLEWLERTRTPMGSLAEKVDVAGRPVSAAPLSWTGATVLLALTALERPLPVP